jgi:hypothetical protein
LAVVFRFFRKVAFCSRDYSVGIAVTRQQFGNLVMPSRGATYSAQLRRWVNRPAAVSIPLARRPLNRVIWQRLRRAGGWQYPAHPRLQRAVPALQLRSGAVQPRSAEPVTPGALGLPEIIIRSLILLALCAASIAVLLQITKGKVVPTEAEGFVTFGVFYSRFVLLFRVVGIASVLTAGFLACLYGGIGWLGMSSRLVVGLYAVAACGWFMVGWGRMSKEELLTEGDSALTWLLCLGVAVGTRQEVWKELGRIAGIAAWLLLPGMLYSLTMLRDYGRFATVNPQVMYLSLVQWFACYYLLSSPSAAWRSKAVRSIPLLCCFLVAVFNQGRGWTVQCVLAFLLLAARPLFLREAKAASSLLQSGVVAALALTIAFFLLLQFKPEAIYGWMARATEDTRTEQYQQFFSQVGVSDLLIGKGPGAGYRFGNRSNYGSFDNQYIWMLFKGGFLIALGYTVLVILPGFRLFFRARNERDYAAAGTLILWSLALAGLSTFNAIGFSAQNYFIVLLAGYCHWRLAAQIPRIPRGGWGMLPPPRIRGNTPPTPARL